eukprot:scaffold19825_cov99-Skeletonema_dohrnii-CCMP3373.AAC.2
MILAIVLQCSSPRLIAKRLFNSFIVSMIAVARSSPMAREEKPIFGPQFPVHCPKPPEFKNRTPKQEAHSDRHETDRQN